MLPTSCIASRVIRAPFGGYETSTANPIGSGYSRSKVTMEDGLVKVIAPIDETLAAKAGVMANDIITKFDDE